MSRLNKINLFQGANSRGVEMANEAMFLMATGRMPDTMPLNAGPVSSPSSTVKTPDILLLVANFKVFGCFSS
jgi:hypothetical protein